MDKDKIEMKTLMESAAVADYLTQLAKGFRSGAIVVEKDGESLTLTPTEMAEVEVEARVKKDKARFSLEVSWRTAQGMDEPASLKISAEAAQAAKCGDKLCEKPSDKPNEKNGDRKDEKKPGAAAVPAKPATAPVKPAAPASTTVSMVKPNVPGTADHKPTPK